MATTFTRRVVLFLRYLPRRRAASIVFYLKTVSKCLIREYFLVGVERLDGGTGDHLAQLVLARDPLHVRLGVVVQRVGDAQHVVLGGDARAAAFAVLHAAPERAPAADAVRHEYVVFVYKLQVAALGLDKVQLTLPGVDWPYNC